MQGLAQGKPGATEIEQMRREALSMATEDVSGIWELVWAINTELPGTEPDVRFLLAQYLLLDLLFDGLVRLVRWNPITGKERAIPLYEAIHVVADARSWSPPEQGTDEQLRFHSTSKGDEAYFRLSA